ncbi:QRFP-like peptide receptor [Nematostella vectensis]|uniref:QRFP-like peptide receptor n=1 Tax=Nematostella vectensis TaxID=45351 RepID=UPI0020776346|nr:QRFP-like peptide receptor [Nematostella vectensis]XP_032239912.2 QRFP-like peptide receptor [Nematostella vectensis]XP_032239913.2 QRFP-like peptide receptor [Nematostella vectensis]XP_032239915.2 QRFP-like peptide receptor [Nematostella vectensis]XP_048587784.1 QRFP-like peptide receptor [Nematostella vectensis]XP_048587795.1 QRFP-like peptide receptor [Nematostella vectensis]XP_048587801.1 QRFP-like peptide receptor [Nematostella vectensis]XP_048587812.1 QRFP-like peptide receptor [Nem
MNSTLEEAVRPIGTNASSEGERNQGLRVAKLCVYLLILLCSASGNTLVILSVVLFRRMKTVPNMFIANLAACDFVTTVSSIPFDLAADELGYWPYGAVMCKLLWPLATFTTLAAVLTLLAISVDRYIALLYPLNIKYRITKRRFYIIMVIVYVVSAWAILPYMIFQEYQPGDGAGTLPQCGEEWPDFSYRKAYTVFLFCLQYGVPLPFMIFIYTKLGMVLFKNTKQMKAFSGGNKAKTNSGTPVFIRRIDSNAKTRTSEMLIKRTESTDSRTRSLNKRRQQNSKTVKMFLLIVTIFLFFMLPNQILWLLFDFGNSEYLLAHLDLIAFTCRAFTYTNSVLNAAIYGACNGSFRNAFACTLKCKCGHKHQRQHLLNVSVYRKDKVCNGRKISRNENANASRDDTGDTQASECKKTSPTKKTVNFLSPHPSDNCIVRDHKSRADNGIMVETNASSEVECCEEVFDSPPCDCEKSLIADDFTCESKIEGLLNQINSDVQSDLLGSDFKLDKADIDKDLRETIL